MTNNTKKNVLPKNAAARIEHFRVENYRALKSIELADITPLTVLLGPNGSGKSTVFDVFNGLRPKEVRVLYRDEQGYTQTVRTSDIQGIPEFVKAGASLGHLGGSVWCR